MCLFTIKKIVRFIGTYPDSGTGNGDKRNHLNMCIFIDYNVTVR